MARQVGLELRAQCPVDGQKYANKPRSESDILSNKIDFVPDKINEVGSKTTRSKKGQSSGLKKKGMEMV